MLVKFDCTVVAVSNYQGAAGDVVNIIKYMQVNAETKLSDIIAYRDKLIKETCCDCNYNDENLKVRDIHIISDDDINSTEVDTSAEPRKE